jgi:hypothetical protein
MLPQKYRGHAGYPVLLTGAVLCDQQIRAVKDNVEIWTEVMRDSKGNVLSGFEAMGFGEAHREVVRTLQRGESLRAFVSIASENTGDSMKNAFFGGGVKTGKVLSVMTFEKDPRMSLYGKVLASDVKVTCVPKDDDFIKEYFPELPTIDWDPE